MIACWRKNLLLCLRRARLKPVYAFMYVFTLRFSMLKKGSRTGNFFDPQRAVCSNTWATPVESVGMVLNVVLRIDEKYSNIMKYYLNTLFVSAVSMWKCCAPVFSWMRWYAVKFRSGIGVICTELFVSYINCAIILLITALTTYPWSLSPTESWSGSLAATEISWWFLFIFSTFSPSLLSGRLETSASKPMRTAARLSVSNLRFDYQDTWWICAWNCQAGHNRGLEKELASCVASAVATSQQTNNLGVFQERSTHPQREESAKTVFSVSAAEGGSKHRNQGGGGGV